MMKLIRENGLPMLTDTEKVKTFFGNIIMQCANNVYGKKYETTSPRILSYYSNKAISDSVEYCEKEIDKESDFSIELYAAYNEEDKVYFSFNVMEGDYTELNAFNLRFEINPNVDTITNEDLEHTLNVFKLAEKELINKINHIKQMAKHGQELCLKHGLKISIEDVERNISSYAFNFTDTPRKIEILLFDLILEKNPRKWDDKTNIEYTEGMKNYLDEGFNIKKALEISNYIRKFYEMPSASLDECWGKREDACSIWGKAEELCDYINQDIDEATHPKVTESNITILCNNIFKLRDGEYLACF